VLTRLRELVGGLSFERVVAAAARRPGATLAITGVLALAGLALALRLEPSAGTDTLVSRSSASFQATERYRTTFGDEAIIVLVEGNLQKTMLTSDLGRLLALEGCMSGNVPEQGLRQLPPVCRELAQLKPAKVVYGPGTFANVAADQILRGFRARQAENERQATEAAAAARTLSRRRGDPVGEQRRLAEAAGNLVRQQFVQEALKIALRYGLQSLPSLDNTQFISQLVFDPSKGNGVPKARFAYLFPSPNAALVQVRLRPELSESERSRAIELVRAAVRDSRFKPENGGRYVVTGVPVVVDALADELRQAIAILLGAALLVMAATLALVFRARLRLLPLALALAAAALSFGAISLVGGSLTMASIAALPVLIGLAVDYAIQFQARFEEERWIDLEAAGDGPPPPPRDTAVAAAVAGAPTIAAAGLSTAVGFCVLLLSPVPMVRGFGALLVLGIVLAFACALTAGFAALVRWHARPEDVPETFPRLRARARRLAGGVAGNPASATALRFLRDVRAWVGEHARRVLWLAIRRPRQALAVAFAVAALGWVADTQIEVVSDVRELVPRDLAALEDVNRLQNATGVSGAIDVTVEADDLTRPEVVAWMTRFQDSVLRAHGYKSGATCAQRRNPPELCPALSLPDLFRSSDLAQSGQVRALLDIVPPYFSQAVISSDRKTATLAFGIRLMPLERQKEVIDDIERRLDPPPGVRASVAGLPVLAAEANGALSSPARRFGTLLAGLLAVFLVLYAIRRRTDLAVVPLIPIALATGWSSLVLFVLQIPLNPMSATLGALVIAISTEFGVLLSARYRQERERGLDPEEALDATYASTGAAVLASGATAIAGFAALVASDIRMLRDFGFVTVIDLSASLLGVMVVLPAAIMWAEERGGLSLRELDPRRALAALGFGGEARAARPPRERRRPRLPALRPRAPRVRALRLRRR
jgi:uncharacterized protein